MKNASSYALYLIVSLALLACENKGTAAPSAAEQGAAANLSVTVDSSGYHPSSVEAPAGKTVQVVFTRTSDQGCGQQLVFPSLGIKKDLPLNQPVSVDVPMPASGNVAFTCGMDMYRGSVVAK